MKWMNTAKILLLAITITGCGDSKDSSNRRNQINRGVVESQDGGDTLAMDSHTADLQVDSKSLMRTDSPMALDVDSILGDYKNEDREK